MDRTQTILNKNKLGELPRRKAVYAIFAQREKTNELINCHYVGETDNLEERTKAHFSKKEANACLLKFMQSDRIKSMLYELMPNSTEEDRTRKEKQWIEKHNPKCNKR